MQDFCKKCTFKVGTNPIECEECLAYLNWTRLLSIPFYTDDINQIQVKSAERYGEFIKVHEIKDPGDLFKFYKHFEQLTVAASMAYEASKIKEKIPDASAAERSNEFSKAVKEQREKNRPKKERKLLSERDKAINKIVEMMAKIMGTEAATEYAKKMVDTNMSKAGRNPGGLE